MCLLPTNDTSKMHLFNYKKNSNTIGNVASFLDDMQQYLTNKKISIHKGFEC